MPYWWAKLSTEMQPGGKTCDDVGIGPFSRYLLEVLRIFNTASVDGMIYNSITTNALANLFLMLIG